MARNQPRKWPLWLGLAVGLVTLAAGLFSGSDETEGWQLAARWTARTAFPLFIVTFSASALARLKPSSVTKALLRDRRWWGLGFAAAFFCHLAALLVYNWRIDNFPPATITDGGFIAYAVLFAMVLTSTDAARHALGRGWKILHGIGMWGFWFIFGPRVYLQELHENGSIETAPLTDPYIWMCALVVLLKLAVWHKARHKRTRS